MAKKVPVILGSEHLRAIDVIQERIGTPTYAAAIRYALLEQALAIKRELAEVWGHSIKEEGIDNG